MLKTENLANIAAALLKMTYREVTDLAGELDITNPDTLLDWAEKYTAPVVAAG